MDDPLEQVGLDRNLDRARWDGQQDLDPGRSGLLAYGLDRGPGHRRAHHS